MEKATFKKALDLEERRVMLEKKVVVLQQQFSELKNEDNPTPVQIQNFLNRLCDDKSWSVEILRELMEARISQLQDSLEELNKLFEAL